MAREATRGAQAPRSNRTGARRAGGTHSGGLRKLLPLLIGVLLAILLALLLISLIGGDDSDDGGNAGSNVGQLAAGSVRLLPPPANGLSAQAGETATGKNVVVQSVNGNEGFFVGSSATDRVYVEWGGDVGENEASRFQPQRGDRVDLTGPVQPAGAKQIRKLKLSSADAELVRSQGAFVNADRVTAAE
ncbi:MAG: hypothetical protein ICV69_09950 [Thermoleophilaceae bacterium]|nr:hypothetical protein [Thermoleophilaceae bacterium]